MEEDDGNSDCLRVCDAATSHPLCDLSVLIPCMCSSLPQFSPRKGRRAAAGEILGTTDDFGGATSPLKSALSSPTAHSPPPSSGPPQGRRRAGGWANSARPG